MRTIVDLPEDTLRALKALARQQNLSQAEAIRRAVRIYLEENRPEPDAEAFGLWAGRTEGLAYERERREEWEA